MKKTSKKSNKKINKKSNKKNNKKSNKKSNRKSNKKSTIIHYGGGIELEKIYNEFIKTMIEKSKNIDIIRQNILISLGVSEESYAYRWTKKKFLNMENNTSEGNLESLANLLNVYNLTEENIKPTNNTLQMLNYPDNELNFNTFKRYLGDGQTIPTFFVNTKITANELTTPGLNMSLNIGDSYKQDNDIFIKIKLKDVFDIGGNIYNDIGSMASGLNNIYLTIPQPVKFEIVDYDRLMEESVSTG